MDDWSHIDHQMLKWEPRLRDDLGLTVEQSRHLATMIAAEVTGLAKERRNEALQASRIPLTERIDELKAYQRWTETINTGHMNPAVIRAQVIVQNYICFVYLGESCFTVLRKQFPPGSPTRRCCCFLTENPVRALRNALAHANWRYTADFQGLEFWAKKGSEPAEPMVRWQVRQLDLDFWADLARCTAYAAFSSLLA